MQKKNHGFNRIYYSLFYCATDYLCSYFEIIEIISNLFCILVIQGHYLYLRCLSCIPELHESLSGLVE